MAEHNDEDTIGEALTGESPTLLFKEGVEAMVNLETSNWHSQRPTVTRVG